MNEREFARKLAARLDRVPVSADAAARLRAAREAAVARAQSQTASGWTHAGGAVVRFWHQHRMASLGLLLALGVAISGSLWQWQRVRAAERALEIELLADNVPLELLLSERVEPWMRR